MRLGFIVVLMLWTGEPAHSQEDGGEPGRLLDLAAKARGKEARDLVGRAVKALAGGKQPKTQAEMEALLVRLARGIENSAQTQKEILGIFGDCQKTEIRQVYFRRYREQWIFEKPRLTVVFDCIKGKEPKVLTVLVPASEN
ncbi:MAG TPA: hypothetical protein VKE98_04060 [Gemmataceae bacterium]|nr:hypothetical protein [Gemmataceae bacterium]